MYLHTLLMNNNIETPVPETRNEVIIIVNSKLVK